MSLTSDIFGEKKQREREKIEGEEEEHGGLGVLYRAEIRTEGP